MASEYRTVGLYNGVYERLVQYAKHQGISLTEAASEVLDRGLPKPQQHPHAVQIRALRRGPSDAA